MGKSGGIIRVQVTEADIRKAEQNNSMRCVVAQALARTLPDATRIDVDVQTIRWSSGGERHIYLTPYSVAGYVVAFDAGDKIEPFTFGLDHRRRVPARRDVKTEAGKETMKAASRTKRQRAKVEKLTRQAQGELLPPPVTPTAIKAVKEKLPAAEAELREAERVEADVRAAYQGAITNGRIGDETRSAPKRVIKSSERHYGMRLLRVNQGEAAR